MKNHAASSDAAGPPTDGRPPRVALVSLGCAKNTVDAESCLGELLDAGWDLAVDADAADLLLINTCGFIASAREEAYEEIGSAIALKRDNPALRIVATGCLAHHRGGDLAAAFPDLDGVFGFGAYSDPVMVFTALLRGELPILYGQEIPTPLERGTRLLFSGGAYAYLRIAEGCDNRCAYCAVPLIRGGLRSRPEQEILAEAEELVAAGVRELDLIAQDTAAYGMDRDGAPRLGPLLARLLEIPGEPWIRILYAHPAHLRMQEDVIDLLAAEPRLLGYLDLPIQHIDDRVLSAMGRRVSRREIEALLEALRGRIPHLTLRTTVLTGFPGEDEAAFRRLAKFVAEGSFQHLGAFAYSPEAGTAAVELPDRPPVAVAEARAEEIMQIQQEVAFAWLDSRVGETGEVLIEAQEAEGEWIGRTRSESPEGIDGVVRVKGQDFSPGERIRACLVRREGYDLIADTE